MISILALLAAAATPPAPAPLESEEEIWKLAGKLRTAPAYQAYLERFPAGDHHDEALASLSRLQGLPVAQAPPAPPAPPRMEPFTPDACFNLLVDQQLKKIDSEEPRALLAARRSNRVSDYQAFVARFSEGICRSTADRALQYREARKRHFVRVAGFGPLAPHRPGFLFISTDDYPAAALRAEESGRVVAEWEVAEDGVPESCHVLESSGSRALDETTCRLVTARLRYDPARDASGTPIRSRDRMSVGWRLPDEDPGPPPPGTDQRPR